MAFAWHSAPTPVGLLSPKSTLRTSTTFATSIYLVVPAFLKRLCFIMLAYNLCFHYSRSISLLQPSVQSQNLLLLHRDWHMHIMALLVTFFHYWLYASAFMTIYIIFDTILDSYAGFNTIYESWSDCIIMSGGRDIAPTVRSLVIAVLAFAFFLRMQSAGSSLLVGLRSRQNPCDVPNSICDSESGYIIKIVIPSCTSNELTPAQQSCGNNSPDT